MAPSGKKPRGPFRIMLKDKDVGKLYEVCCVHNPDKKVGCTLMEAQPREEECSLADEIRLLRWNRWFPYRS